MSTKQAKKPPVVGAQGMDPLSGSSDQSSQVSGASAEVKAMMNNASKIKKDLLSKVEQRADEGTVMDALKSYVSYISDTAQSMMDSGNLKPAQQILRGCEKCLKTKVPHDYTYSQGFLFTINNNLAQLANRLGDVELSVKYLEAAVESSLDPRIQNQNDLPLAETYLNVANAHSFLGKHLVAIGFADKAEIYAAQQCARLEQALTMAVQRQDADTLNEQYNCQINLKIMSLHAKGTNYEKLKQFQKAIAQFQAGKQLVEQTFGTEHQLYAVFSSAMGGAKLKTKYQTPQDNRRTKSRSKSSSSDEGKKKKKSSVLPRIAQVKKRDNLKPTPATSARPMFERASSVTKIKKTRNINMISQKFTSSSTIDKSDHRVSKKSSLQNTILNSSTGFRDSAISKMKHSHAHTSIRSRSNSNNSRYAKEDIGYLNKMRRESDHKKVVCKNGPNCLNHDWDKRSPLKKVCQRDQNCVNHDWSKVDRSNSPFKVVCKKGPNCNNHDWNRRSPMQRLVRDKQVPKHTEATSIQIPTPEVVYQQEPAPVVQSEHDHQCMMHQSERMYQQQMTTMRQMQEEQFKMLELVMEKKGSQNQQCQGHNSFYHPQMMGYPQMHMMMPPQYPPQPMYGGYMMPPSPMPNQFSQSQMQQSHGATTADLERANPESQNSSCSCSQDHSHNTGDDHHMSSSEAEESSSSGQGSDDPPPKRPKHSKKDKKKQKSENQKSQIKEEQSPEAYELRKAYAVHEMTTHENFKRSVHYDESYKDFNDRDTDAVMESYKSVPRLSHSASATDAYQHVGDQKEVQSAKSHKSRKSSLKSQSSFQSYHAEFVPVSQDPQQAAILIQKNFRRHLAQTNFKLQVKKTSKVFFKSVFNTTIITCIQVQQGDKKLMQLRFQVKGHSEVTVDLSDKNIPLSQDLSLRVKRVLGKVSQVQDIETEFLSAESLKILGSQLLSPQMTMMKVKMNKVSTVVETIPHQSDVIVTNTTNLKIETETGNMLNRLAVGTPQNITSRQSSSSSSSSSSSERGKFDPGHKSFEKQRRLRQKQIEEEIEMIKRKNHFEAFAIDEVYHRDNKEILAASPKRTKFRDDGLDPVIIERVVVSKKKPHRHTNSDGSSCSSSYSSENSYEFQTQKIEMLKKASSQQIVDIASIVKIQAAVRGLLARKSFSFKQSRVLFSSKIEKCDTLWFCKLIKFSMHDYSLTVRLASDSHQQMIKRFKTLPFKDEEADPELPEYLHILIKNEEWVDIDLIKSVKEEVPPVVQSRPIQSQKEPETPTSKSMLLFLDVQREQGTYRVSVHQRKDLNFPYQLKVTCVKDIDPTHEISLNIKTLGESSSGIRQFIWYHLQVRLTGGKLTEVYFSDDKVVIDLPPKPFVPVSQVTQVPQQQQPVTDQKAIAYQRSLRKLQQNSPNKMPSNRTQSTQNILVPQITDAIPPIVVKSQVQTRSSLITFTLTFDETNRNVMMSLKNETTHKMLCQEMPLDEDLVEAAGEWGSFEARTKLKETLSRLIEAHHLRLKAAVPNDFQILLREKLTLADSSLVQGGVSSSFGDKTIVNEERKSSRENSQAFDSENDDDSNSDDEQAKQSKLLTQKTTGKSKHVHTKGIVMGGSMFQFVFDGDIASNEFKLTVRNQSSKKYICQAQFVQCDHFRNMDKVEALEQVHKTIVERIKEHGKSFTARDDGLVPECLRVL